MSTKDLKFYDSEKWQSLSELAAAQVEPVLPISSADGTVVLDSPSANTFTIETGGEERVKVSDTAATFDVDVQTARIIGLATNNASIDLGENAKVVASGRLCQTEWVSATNAIEEVFASRNFKSYANNGVVNFVRTDDTVATNLYWYDVNLAPDQKTNASVGAGGFTINATKTLGLTGDGIHFAPNTKGDPSTILWEMTSEGGLIGTPGGYIQTPSVSGLADNDASIELGATAKITAGTSYYQLYSNGYHVFQSDGSQSRFTNDGRFLVNTSTLDVGYLSTFLQNKSGETGIVRFVTNNTDGTASLYLDCDPVTGIVGLKTNQQLCITQVAGSDYTPTRPDSIATVRYVLDNAGGDAYDDTQIKADLASEVSAREAADQALQDDINSKAEIWTGTQAEYDALGIYSNYTLYCITD